MDLLLKSYGAKSGVSWNQERPDELWIGHRNDPQPVIIKDPSLLKEGARSYADLPGGHSEGYDDTFKQVFRRFYQSIAEPGSAAEYPQIADGLRQMNILQAEFDSNRTRAWVHELLPLCREENLAVLPWSPLSGGFLSGKYRRDNPNPEGARRTGFQFPPIDEARGFDAVEALDSIAKEKKVTVAQVALASLWPNPASPR